MKYIDTLSMPKARSISKSTKDAVDAQFDCCAYCGDKLGPFEYDHIKAVELGGTGELENITKACRGCNSWKGKRSLRDFQNKVEMEIYRMELASEKNRKRMEWTQGLQYSMAKKNFERIESILNRLHITPRSLENESFRIKTD